jgi:hypothetical protein
MTLTDARLVPKGIEVEDGEATEPVQNLNVENGSIR